MFKILGIIALGGLIGYLFQNRIKGAVVSKIIMGIIYLLLLILGIAVGVNDTIIQNLSTIGVKALILSVAAVLGSVLTAKILYNKLYRKKEEGSSER